MTHTLNPGGVSVKSGREIAMSINPNTSNDVCTFCRYATMSEDILDAPKCALGFDSYFRSLSNLGPIWVSDCKRGEFRPELAAIDTAHNPAADLACGTALVQFDGKAAGR